MMLSRLRYIKCRSLGTIQSGNDYLLQNIHNTHVTETHISRGKIQQHNICNTNSKACSLIHTRMLVNLLKMNRSCRFSDGKEQQPPSLISIFCVLYVRTCVYSYMCTGCVISMQKWKAEEVIRKCMGQKESNAKRNQQFVIVHVYKQTGKVPVKLKLHRRTYILITSK